MQKLFFPLLFIAGIIMISCQEDEEPITPPVASDTTSVDSTVVVSIDLKGYVQKGPFINSTAITLSELNEKLTATGKNFTTQIADNRGSFSLKDIELESDFVQLQANGFYFDEVKGEKSAAQLTLFALADVSNASSVNVNLLSHLERNRVVYLMQEKKQEFAEAKKQAQQEILTALGIVQDSIGYSEQLDISQKGDQNAILLAISAVLQGNNGVADLSELLGNLITDLREDGTLNSETIKTKIEEQAKVLDLLQIRKNLEARYAEMGVEATIPNFEQYIDSDGDGILNKDEDDTPEGFAFKTQLDVAANDTITSNAITISGLKEGGIAIASVTSGWLLVNNNILADSVIEVKNGDELQIQLVSTDQFSDTTRASVTIGTISRAFNVITDDYSPDDFTFANLTDAQPDKVYYSDTVTLSGIPHPTQISIENGTLFINNQEVLETETTVVSGDKIYLQLPSSIEFSTATLSTVQIGARQFDFQVTTYQNPWQRKADFPGIIAAYYAPGFVINGKIYYGLGTPDESLFPKKFYQYDPSTDQWSRIADFPGAGRAQAVAFSLASKGYVGLDSFYSDSDDFWEYDPEIDQWKQVADYPGTGGNLPYSFTVGDKAYVGSGYDAQTIRNFWEFDPAANSWNRIADFPYTYYSDMGFTPNPSASHNGFGYIFPTDGFFQGPVYKYSPNTDEWSILGDMIDMSEIPIVQSSNGHTVGFFIGSDDRERWFVKRFDTQQQRWVRIAAPKWAFHSNNSFFVDDRVYTVIATLRSGKEVTELWEYTPPPVQD
ncbi:MAG: hypothetical protein AAF992_22970 [Bacteroidota bacterium]